MSKITIEGFLAKIKNDKHWTSDLNKALREANTSKIVEIARENGYTISEKDLSTGYLGASVNAVFKLKDSILE